MSVDIKTLQTLMCTPGIGGRRGLRPLLEGPPGTGKTTMLEGVCRAMGAYLITMIASIREPADYLGIPMPDGNGGVIYAVPAWVREANKRAEAGQLVVVFLDEFTTCGPAVQNAMLRMINEGYVGEAKLHVNVTFIAASNPVEITAGGFELSPPMANRWMHLQWHAPSASDWIDGILSNWADVDAAASGADIMKKMDASFEVAYAKAKGTVTSFLKGNSNLLNVLPDAANPDASKAWPSGRTWELAMRTLAGCEIAGIPEEVQDDLIEGCVGKGPTAEFRQYQSDINLPDPVKLLDAKDPLKIWKHDPSRADVAMAVFNTCTALVTPVAKSPKKAKIREARAENIWKIVADVGKNHSDVAAGAADALARASLTNSPIARSTMHKMFPTMVAMGRIK